LQKADQPGKLAVASRQEDADTAAATAALEEFEKKHSAEAIIRSDEPRRLVAGPQGDADTVAAAAALEEYERKLGAATTEDANKGAAAAALERQKAQEDVARRVENLQNEIRTQPAGAAPPAAAAVTSGTPSKEQRLRDLLRRYNADEITPLEYHTERAKIVAEP
jgi:hypothetical protein